MNCDFCGEETKPNDQNDVALNKATYMLCQYCFDNLCSLFDIYRNCGNKFSILELFTEE